MCEVLPSGFWRRYSLSDRNEGNQAEQESAHRWFFHAQVAGDPCSSYPRGGCRRSDHKDPEITTGLSAFQSKGRSHYYRSTDGFAPLF
jgi:hypothetical protein